MNTSEEEEASIKVDLLGLTGNERASIETNLPPLGKIARMINDLFPGFDFFGGSIEVSSTTALSVMIIEVDNRAGVDGLSWRAYRPFPARQASPTQ